MAWEILHNAKVLQNTDTGEIGIRCGRSNEVTRVTEAHEYTIPDFGYKAAPLDADMSPIEETALMLVEPLVEGKTYTYSIGGETFTGVCWRSGDDELALGDTFDVLDEAMNNNDFSGLLGHTLYAYRDGEAAWQLSLWAPKYMTEHPDDDTVHVTSQDIKMAAAIQALPAVYTMPHADSIVNATLMFANADAVYKHEDTFANTGEPFIHLLCICPLGRALGYMQSGVAALFERGDSLYLGSFGALRKDDNGTVCTVSGEFSKVSGTGASELQINVSPSMEVHDKVGAYPDGYWTDDDD